MVPVIICMISMTTLASALLFLAAGGCLYVYFFNRVFMHLKESAPKALIVFVSFVILVPVLTVVGFAVGLTLWALAPAIVLLGCAVGEVRLIVARRKLRGRAPVESRNARQSLWQPCTTTDLATIRYELPCPQLGIPCLRIVQLSDLHISDRLPGGYYASAVARANELTPDLVFLTGDYAGRSQFTKDITPLLSPLRARVGVYAVLGNHDYWYGAKRCADALAEAGAKVLLNEQVDVSVGADAAVMLIGCDHPWTKWPAEASPIPAGTVSLALTHHLDNVYRLNRLGATAVFSGHTHGGQWCLPLVGSIVTPSRYGRRFDRGHFVIDGTHLFISAGVGAAYTALRLYCPPDILVVDLLGTPPQPDSV